MHIPINEQRKQFVQNRLIEQLGREDVLSYLQNISYNKSLRIKEWVKIAKQLYYKKEIPFCELIKFYAPEVLLKDVKNISSYWIALHEITGHRTYRVNGSIVTINDSVSTPKYWVLHKANGKLTTEDAVWILAQSQIFGIRELFKYLRQAIHRVRREAMRDFDRSVATIDNHIKIISAQKVMIITEGGWKLVGRSAFSTNKITQLRREQIYFADIPPQPLEYYIQLIKGSGNIRAAVIPFKGKRTLVIDSKVCPY